MKNNQRNADYTDRRRSDVVKNSTLLHDQLVALLDALLRDHERNRLDLETILDGAESDDRPLTDSERYEMNELAEQSEQIVGEYHEMLNLRLALLDNCRWIPREVTDSYAGRL